MAREVTITAAITTADILVTRTPKEGVVIESDGGLTVAFDTTLDNALLEEGRTREIVSRLQRVRKEIGLAVTDRVHLTYHSSWDPMIGAVINHLNYVASEALAVKIDVVPADGGEHQFEVDGMSFGVTLARFEA